MNPKRKTAPNVKVGGHVDKRFEYVAQLEKENPDFVYSYQRPEVTNWELKTRNQEIVMKDGERDHWMGDPIVRVPRKLREAQWEEQSERSRIVAQSVVDNERLTQQRSPKYPIERKKK